MNRPRKAACSAFWRLFLLFCRFVREVTSAIERHEDDPETTKVLDGSEDPSEGVLGLNSRFESDKLTVISSYGPEILIGGKGHVHAYVHEERPLSRSNRCHRGKTQLIGASASCTCVLASTVCCSNG